MRQLLLKQGGNGIGRFDLSAVDRCQQLPPSVGYPHPDLDGLDNIIRIVGDWLDPKRVTEAVAV